MLAGDYVIVALNSVVDGNPEEFSKERRDSLVDELVQDNGRSSYNAYVQALREQADIVIGLMKELSTASVAVEHERALRGSGAN